jgi:hypothetical protein
MIKFFKKYFQKKPKALLIDNTFRIIPAFELKGEIYYMHEDPLNTCTGRGLTAMMFMEELVMRCSANYLQLHVEALDKLFSDSQRINLPMVMRLHSNMKERINLTIAFPEHVYKMASVVFFTKDESPYNYDGKYNEKKIADWKQAPGMYDFFLQTPLKELMPFLQLPEASSKDYLKVAEKINLMHLRNLQEVLGRNISTTDT